MPQANHRDSLPAGPPPSPWTASRCNRLLRQLTSFVSRLERWHKAFSIAQEEDTTGDVLRASVGGQSGDDLQPAWLSQNPSKDRYKVRKKCKTYSKAAVRTPLSKGHSVRRSAEKTPRNDHILSLTNIALTGDAHHERAKCSSGSVAVPSRSTKRSSSSRSSVHIDSSSHLWTARTAHLAPDYEHIMQDGWATLPTFLVATFDPGPRTHLAHAGLSRGENAERGAKSLLHMCLAKLSQNMVEQQREIDSKRDGYDGQADCIGSQLQELEDFFGDSRTGWPPLRALTRTCGISLVTQLIREGAVLEESAIELAIRWHGFPAFLDLENAIKDSLVARGLGAAALHKRFRAWPDLDQFFSPPDEHAHAQLVWRTQLSVNYMLRAFEVRDDATLLISRVLRWRHLCAAIMASRANEGGQPARASNLLEAVYLSALSSQRLEDWDSLRTMSTMRTMRTMSTMGTRSTMSTMRIRNLDVSRSGLEPVEGAGLDDPSWDRLKMALHLMISLAFGSSSGDLPQLMEKISKRSQIVLELDRCFELSRQQRCLVAQIFFANMCQRIMNGRDVCGGLLLESFETLLGSLDSSWAVSRTLVGAMLAMATGWRDFQHLVGELLSMANDNCERVHLLLGQVCAEAAMDYAAEHRDNAAIPRWASEVLEKSQTRKKTTCTPVEAELQAVRDVRIGYQWDEAMQEWIAQTPATLLPVGGRRTTGSATGEESRPSGERTTATSESEETPGRRHRRRRQHHYHHRPNLALRSPMTDAISYKRINAVVYCDRPKGKRGVGDFETFTDGDFEYKKARRKMLPYERFGWTSGANCERTRTTARVHGPENRSFEDSSEDELSLME